MCYGDDVVVIVWVVFDMFYDGGFSYMLVFVLLGCNVMDDFLFFICEGYCEYYVLVFIVLMCVVGVLVCVVIGY